MSDRIEVMDGLEQFFVAGRENLLMVGMIMDMHHYNVHMGCNQGSYVTLKVKSSP